MNLSTPFFVLQNDFNYSSFILCQTNNSPNIKFLQTFLFHQICCSYTSHTVNNYSQIEKERLVRAFWVKPFYCYVLGTSLYFIADHKPLLGLLGENKPTSPQASARIQCLSVHLAMFEYSLKFWKTTDFTNADAFSKLPLLDQLSSDQVYLELLLSAHHLAKSPATCNQIDNWTQKNQVLCMTQNISY